MTQFKAGDWCTRDGTDIHVVVELDETGIAMTVECIKAPESGWTSVGDREFNLCRRYDLVPIQSLASGGIDKGEGAQ